MLLPAGPMQGPPGEGSASISLTVPDEPTLTGLSVYSQWLILGPALSASEGAELTLF